MSLFEIVCLKACGTVYQSLGPVVTTRDGLISYLVWKSLQNVGPGAQVLGSFLRPLTALNALAAIVFYYDFHRHPLD